jgi:hypothetical protein
VLKPADRPPDYECADLNGVPRRLHEFRRKTHVVLICNPEATPAQRALWKARRTAESQRWTWLQAEALVPLAPLPDTEPGIYLIARWGHVITMHPPGDWDMDRIEKDLLTFESQDCCDLSKAP